MDMEVGGCEHLRSLLLPLFVATCSSLNIELYFLIFYRNMYNRFRHFLVYSRNELSHLLIPLHYQYYFRKQLTHETQSMTLHRSFRPRVTNVYYWTVVSLIPVSEIFNPNIGTLEPLYTIRKTRRQKVDVNL